MSDYIESGELAGDLAQLQRMSYLNGVRHVLGVMEESLESKRRIFDDPATKGHEKVQLSYEIDLLRKMVKWAREEVSE